MIAETVSETSDFFMCNCHLSRPVMGVVKVASSVRNHGITSDKQPFKAVLHLRKLLSDK